MKETLIQRVEYFFEIVVVALRARVALAAPGMAYEFGLAGHRGAGGEALETRVVRGVDCFLVKLGEKNVRDGANDAFRRALNEVGEADEDFSFAETNGGVEGSESAKANSDWRDRRPRTQDAIFLLKYRYKISSHQN